MLKLLQKGKRFLFSLEFHEMLCVLMLVFIVILYEAGLADKKIGILQDVQHIVSDGSPITKLFALLLGALGVISRVLRKGGLKDFAVFLFRIMSSFLVMLFSFESITYFSRVRQLPLLDGMLQSWDSYLFFGKQPAEWLVPLINEPLTIVLSGAYLSWFIFLYCTVMLLYVKGRQPVVEYTAAALLTFYIGYIFYLLVPGIGPLYTYTFSTPLGGLTALLLRDDLIRPAADVFPSLHTALSVVMLVQVWRYYRAWAWLYAPLTVLVVFSTVYLRIHYVVDLLAGIVLSAITVVLTPYLVKRWDKVRQKEVKVRQKSSMYSGIMLDSDISS